MNKLFPLLLVLIPILFIFYIVTKVKKQQTIHPVILILIGAVATICLSISFLMLIN